MVVLSRLASLVSCVLQFSSVLFFSAALSALSPLFFFFVQSSQFICHSNHHHHHHFLLLLCFSTVLLPFYYYCCDLFVQLYSECVDERQSFSFLLFHSLIVAVVELVPFASAAAVAAPRNSLCLAICSACPLLAS